MSEDTRRAAWRRKDLAYGAHALTGQLRLPNATSTVEDRFLIKVFLDHPSGCWRWLGSRTYGYGLFRPGVPYRAHRWAYEHWIGPIPDGLTLDHLCQDHGCVNPWHLEPVTRAENIRRHRVEHREPSFPSAPASVLPLLNRAAALRAERLGA